MMKRGKYTEQGVVRRGREILLGWDKNKLSSRKIVRAVQVAAAKVKAGGGANARTELLCYLYALDMRIKEKYAGLLICLLRFFSWRREMCALEQVKKVLGISEQEKDLREAISVELRKIRKALKIKENEGEDDETRGGKQNAKAEEEALEAEEDAEELSLEEEAEEEAPEEESEKEADKEADRSRDPKSVQEKSTERGEAHSEKEQAKAEGESSLRGEKERGGKNESRAIKEEKAADLKSASKMQTAKETGGYKGAADPLSSKEEIAGKATEKAQAAVSTEETAKSGTQMKQQVNENRGFVDIAPEVRREPEAVREPAEVKTEAQERAEKFLKLDNMLYDERMRAMRGASSQNTQKTENSTQASQEKAAEKSTEKSTVADNKTEEESRVPLQVDMAAMESENEMRRIISEIMPENEKQQYFEMMAESMREQLKILSSEVGMDDRVEILGKNDPVQTKPTDAELNRK